ncbi:MAG: hypothetical protein JWL71_1936 [Acidobacteria bacterium]|nr:hypothetical protein [Acidobacteriota bacterium]
MPNSPARTVGPTDKAKAAEGRLENDDSQVPLFVGFKRGLIRKILLRARRVLWRANFSAAGRYQGRRVVVPFILGNGPQHFALGERWLLSAFQTVMSLKRGAFVDVGVNVGQTMLKVKLLDPDREYVGFEPNPIAFSYASRLAEINHFDHCTLAPIGLSNCADVLRLFSKADADPSASIVEHFREATRYSREQLVSVHNGDTVLHRLGVTHIAVIKIDVEGGELEVLEGLDVSIRASQPLIFCEVLPVYDPFSETGAFRLKRQQRVFDLLKSNSYAIIRLLIDGRAEHVPEFGIHSDVSRSNYLFAPSRDVPQVVAELMRSRELK